MIGRRHEAVRQVFWAFCSNVKLHARLPLTAKALRMFARTRVYRIVVARRAVQLQTRNPVGWSCAYRQPDRLQG